MTLDPATLPAGVGYDSQIALLDTKSGTVSASVIGGRPLPDWLSFDAATRTVSLSGFAPDADAQLARLQVVFTPAPRVLPDGTYASSNRGFTLEFVVDPHGDLASQMTAINHALEGESYFADRGLFALDLKGAGAITATRESGAPLPDWLSFDPATFTFSGMPPANWVGAVPVRLDIAAGNGHPAMSIITEAVVDDTFKIAPFPISTVVSPEQINVTVPTDFNGTVVLSYDATDEKGGVSGNPALIFYDVKPTRERPDAAVDNLMGREGQSTRFAVTDLLRNDFDRDRDALRILSLGQPANGSLVIEPRPCRYRAAGRARPTRRRGLERDARGRLGSAGLAQHRQRDRHALGRRPAGIRRQSRHPLHADAWRRQPERDLEPAFRRQRRGLRRLYAGGCLLRR